MKATENFSEVLKFNNDSEKIDFINDTIQLDLLHALVDRSGLRKSDIAKKLGVSNSFVSQLFSGDKRLSIRHLASLIYHFNLNFRFELDSKTECKFNKYENYPTSGTGIGYFRFAISESKYHLNKNLNEKEKTPNSI